MDKKTTYVPKSGDKVSASGRDGEFIVHSVDSDRHTVDVRVIGPPNAVNVIGVPWETLKQLKSHNREDVNQAAARIIREATERD